jgi:hypothetical protein
VKGTSQVKQFKESHLRAVALGCGVLLVLLGVARHLGLDLGEKAERWIGEGLFFGAALVFLQLFNQRRRARDAARKP